MIERTGLQDQERLSERSDAFPPFTRQHVTPDTGNADDDLSGSSFSYESGYVCKVTLADELIEKLRKAGEETEVQHHDNVPLTPKAEPKSGNQPAPESAIPAVSPTGGQNPPPKKKKQE
ncbi:hypothetical protein P0D88_37325 [Paraburkholderia sp. RL18-103-BIB-C]|jgi:hypothetical protein|uniref:hypothetical protein n=1 Tax=unclassified Paraburkholderia TaxID=2615204 RepID=UPI0038BAA201